MLLMGNPLFLWPFSIAMFVHQRVRDLMIYTPIQWQFTHNFSWEVTSMMDFKAFLTQRMPAGLEQMVF